MAAAPGGVKDFSIVRVSTLPSAAMIRSASAVTDDAAFQPGPKPPRFSQSVVGTKFSTGISRGGRPESTRSAIVPVAIPMP
jgi:hypothetical protein